MEELSIRMTRNSIKKQKVILALVGLPGAGKTTATRYLVEKHKKNLIIVHFGKIVNDYIDRHGLEHTKETHKKIWLSLRKKYGQEAFAVLNEEKIRQALKKGSVIIDGLRSWEEYIYLKNKFSANKIYIIAIYSDKKIRYARSAKRKYRSDLYGEDRDIAELILMNMGPTIAFCDFLIVNNKRQEELQLGLDDIYHRILNS